MIVLMNITIMMTATTTRTTTTIIVKITPKDAILDF